MRIKLTKEHKIALLEALQTGYLDTWNIPELYGKDKLSAFMELLMETSCDAPTSENI